MPLDRELATAGKAISHLNSSLVDLVQTSVILIRNFLSRRMDPTHTVCQSCELALIFPILGCKQLRVSRWLHPISRMASYRVLTDHPHMWYRSISQLDLYLKSKLLSTAISILVALLPYLVNVVSLCRGPWSHLVFVALILSLLTTIVPLWMLLHQVRALPNWI